MNEEVTDFMLIEQVTKTMSAASEAILKLAENYARMEDEIMDLQYGFRLLQLEVKKLQAGSE